MRYKKSLGYRLYIIAFIYSYIFSFCLCPIVALAGVQPSVTKLSEVKLPFVTKSYITKRQDSLSSLSKGYNISVTGLLYLNRKISHLKEKGNLPKGLRLVMPKTVLTLAQSKKLDELIKLQAEEFYLREGKNGKKPSPVSGWLARFAQLFASQQKKTEALKDLGAQSVSEALNTTLSAWLGQYGTAKIDLSLNGRFGLDNASAEALFPLYDKDQNLIFSQGGFRRAGGRTQMNIGIGSRHFSDSAMYGFNSFLDYDLSGKHARFGMGGEYWRDYLKFAANGYIAMTGLRESATINNVDYDAKPANGFDVNANFYIPFYPQLGVSAGYEKYFGEGVDLFNEKALMKDPSAYSFGVTYAPVPLINMGVDYKYASNQQSQTRLGVEMTYRLGVPIAAQLDSANVDALRKLQGSRYELVNRNNNIILNYTKNVTIVEMIPSIEGHFGETYSLFKKAQISSRWKLKAWDNPGKLKLSAACYSLQNLASCQVSLPAYKGGEASQNTYPLTMILEHNGNSKQKIFASKISVIRYDSALTIHEHIHGQGGDTLPVFVKGLLNKEWENRGWELSPGFKERGGSLSKECNSLDNLQACMVTLPKCSARAKDNLYQIAFTAFDKIENKAVYRYATINVDSLPLSKKFSNFSIAKANLPYHSKTEVTLLLVDEHNNPIDIPQNDIKNYIHFTIEPKFEELGLTKTTAEEPYYGKIVAYGKGVYKAEFYSGAIEQNLYLRAYFYGHSSEPVSVHIFDDKPDVIKTKFKVNQELAYAGGEVVFTIEVKNQYGKPLADMKDRLGFDIVPTLRDKFVVNKLPYELLPLEEKSAGIYVTHFTTETPGNYRVVPKILLKAQDKDFYLLKEQAKTIVFESKEFDSVRSKFGADDDELAPHGQGDKKEKTFLRFIAEDTQGKPVLGLERYLSFVLLDKNDEPKEHLKVMSLGGGVYVSLFDIKQENGYRPDGDYVFQVAYKDDLLHNLKTKIKVQADLSIPDPDRTEFDISNNVLMLKRLSGYPATLRVVAKNKLGQIYDSKKIRMVILTMDGKAVAGNIASLEQQESTVKETLSYRLYALKEGQYQAVVQYKDQKGNYVDLGKKTIFFINEIPANSSKFVLNYDKLAVNNSANYQVKANLTATLYDPYGHPLDYDKLSGDKSLSEKLYVYLVKKPYKNNKFDAKIPLHLQKANLYEGTISADFVKTVSPLGDQYDIQAFFDSKKLGCEEKTITISPNLAFCENAVVDPKENEIIFNRGDKNIKLSFTYYTAEGFLQGDVGERISYRVFKDDQQLGETLLNVATTPNKQSQYIVTFTPDHEGDYTIKSYYQIYGLLHGWKETPAIAKIHVTKGKKSYDVDSLKSQLKAVPSEIATDDDEGKRDRSQIILRVVNQDGKPTEGLTNVLDFAVYNIDNKLVEILPVEQETEKGIYSTTFKVFNQGKLKLPGVYRIVPRYKQSIIEDISTKVTISSYSAKPHIGKSELELSQEHGVIKTDGGSDIIANVYLHDSYGNLIRERQGKTYYPYKLVLLDHEGNIDDSDKKVKIAKLMENVSHSVTGQFSLSGVQAGTYKIALMVANDPKGQQFKTVIEKKIAFVCAKPGKKSYSKLEHDKLYVLNETWKPIETRFDLYVCDDKGGAINSEAVLKHLGVKAFLGKNALEKPVVDPKKIQWEKGTNHFYVSFDSCLGQGFNRVGEYQISWTYDGKVLESTSVTLKVNPIPRLVPDPHKTVSKVELLEDGSGRYKITFKPFSRQGEPLYGIWYQVEIYSATNYGGNNMVTNELIEPSSQYVKIIPPDGTATYQFILDPKIITKNGYYIIRVNYMALDRYTYELQGYIFYKDKFKAVMDYRY